MGLVQDLYGVSNAGSSMNYVSDYQIRKAALDMAASLLGTSTNSPEILTDAAKKIEAYLRGESNKN